ncbi:MAG TPA: hypothetical protein VI980_07260 [Acidimicrobiia bacterium]|nr:hypothetical protein [Acidimicrobiia bacterium]
MSETAAAPSPRRFSIAHLLLVVPWVALVIDAWAPIRDNSFLWHIRAGDLQAMAGEVLTADPFSFTMNGEPWLTQSWLAELLYAWGERNWGLGFVPPMMLLMTSIIFLGIGLIGYRRSRSVSGTAAVLMLSTMLLISFLVPRPVILSFALLVLVILAWERPVTRWALPLLFWVWASIHGSFSIGLAYVGLSLVAEREWKWLPTAILCGLVTLLTAHGLGVVTVLLEFVYARDALALLSEWRKPEIVSVVFVPFLVGLALIVWAAIRGRVTPRHLWVIVPFLALGLGATRAIPPAWIALLPLVSLGIYGLKVGSAPRFSTGQSVVFCAAVLVLPFLLASDGSLDHERFPIAAVAALDPGRTFHDDRTGGYLIWAEGPARQVYVDDRAELYRDRLAEFVAVRDGDQPFEPVFERDGIEQALLKTSEPLVDDLKAAGWEPVFEDEQYVVLRPESQ